MKSGGSSKKPLVITLIAVILLTVLIIVTNGSAVSNWLKNGIASIVTPIEGAAAKASDAIESFFRNLFNTTDADREASDMEAEQSDSNNNDNNADDLEADVDFSPFGSEW